MNEAEKLIQQIVRKVFGKPPTKSEIDLAVKKRKAKENANASLEKQKPA
jgi:hypothetical protein